MRAGAQKRTRNPLPNPTSSQKKGVWKNCLDLQRPPGVSRGPGGLLKPPEKPSEGLSEMALGGLQDLQKARPGGRGRLGPGASRGRPGVVRGWYFRVCQGGSPKKMRNPLPNPTSRVFGRTAWNLTGFEGSPGRLLGPPVGRGVTGRPDQSGHLCSGTPARARDTCPRAPGTPRSSMGPASASLECDRLLLSTLWAGTLSFG